LKVWLALHFRSFNFVIGESQVKDAGKKAFRMSPVDNEQERERILSDFERWWNESENIT